MNGRLMPRHRSAGRSSGLSVPPPMVRSTGYGVAFASPSTKEAASSAGVASARALLDASARFCASGVSGGILPSFGSMMSEVRLVAITFFPRPVNASLYAPSTSAVEPRSSRALRPGAADAFCSRSATSSSVRNSRPAYLFGRSSGVR